MSLLINAYIANTDTEVSHHALVTFNFLTKFIAFGWQRRVTEGATFIYDVLAYCSG